jgi:hypothetical protein
MNNSFTAFLTKLTQRISMEASLNQSSFDWETKEDTFPEKKLDFGKVLIFQIHCPLKEELAVASPHAKL